MIDPKFNTLPKEAEGDLAEEAPVSSSEGAERLKRPRPGLSINDTVAANANLSVGSRGVDTSGTKAGSGAGAGMTLTTPGQDSSPAPNIQPGGRGSGTTVRSDSASGQIPTTRVDTGTESAETASSAATGDEISERAYQCWHERGCPHGSPEVDWHRAEQELRERKRQSKGLGAASGR